MSRQFKATMPFIIENATFRNDSGKAVLLYPFCLLARVERSKLNRASTAGGQI
jgi:hypothetical protein